MLLLTLCLYLLYDVEVILFQLTLPEMLRVCTKDRTAVPKYQCSCEKHVYII